MAHKLLLDIKDSVHDNRYLRITDLSRWDATLLVDNRSFQVLPPFADAFIEVPLPQNQETMVDAIMLGLSDQQADLPDGPYRFHYSVSPNDIVRHDRCHYRVASLLNAVLGKMATIQYDATHTVDDCGNVEITKMENTLIHIWMLLQGCQSVGRHAHLQPTAERLYKQALHQYDRLFDEHNCINC